MKRLGGVFRDLHQQRRKALLPYVTAGYPDLGTTVEILGRLDPARCACVELGIPFSDPIADGPIIQTSFSRALERGFKLTPLWDALRGARRDGKINVPMVAMVSYSIVYRQGAGSFLRAAVAAGIEGLIVPDLSIEEANDLATACKDHNCSLVMIIAPTTEPSRRERIARLSEPFLYYQSLAGVTGERDKLPPDLTANVNALRAAACKPVCVGFGISRPEHVAAVCQVADGAIVGSAIVRRMNEAVDRGESAQRIAEHVCGFIEELGAALPT